MKQVRSLVLVLTRAGALVFAFLTGCSLDDGAGSGTYQGSYSVPVAPALADAAVYDVPRVEWRVSKGTATLEYDLPRGLVGKSVRVEFEGAMDPSATAVTLTGAAGTAECTLSKVTVSCHEKMAGLLPLEPDYGVIEDLAAIEYAGPASQRIDVAKQFAIDPIGIVDLDLGAPAGETPEVEEHDD